VIRLFLIAGVVAMAQYNTPPDVVSFLRNVASDLSNSHPDPVNQPSLSPREFLDHFDPSMPGYTKLRDYVEELTARVSVGSSIEIVSESGDEKKRDMQLDWVLEMHDDTMQQDRPRRRELIQCTIEKKGKKWKFVAFSPIDFFKY